MALSKDDRLRAKIGVTARKSTGADAPTIAMTTVGAAIPARFEGVERTGKDFKRIALSRIVGDPNQPRRTFSDEELDELASSLGSEGQQSPASVYWSDYDRHYVLVFGERRWRAAERAGVKDLECEILPARPSDSEILRRQLAENLQRSDVPPLEEAAAFRRLMDLDGLNMTQLAEQLGINQPKVAKRLALLGLADPVRALVADGRIGPSIAYEISRLPEELQADMATSVIEADLKRDQVAAEVGEILDRRSRPPELFPGNNSPTDHPSPISGPELFPGNKPGETSEDESMLPDDDSPVVPAHVALPAGEGRSRPFDGGAARPVGDHREPTQGIPGKPSTCLRPVVGWLVLADGGDTEAIYKGSDGDQGVQVYLKGNPDIGRLVDLLSEALSKAKLLYLLSLVSNGPAVPGCRVRLDKPKHYRDGKTGFLTEEYDTAGYLVVRWGDDKCEPASARNLTVV